MKAQFAELYLNNKLLIRQPNKNLLKLKIRQFGLTDEVKANQRFKQVDVIATTLPKKIGSIFEGTL